MIVGLILLVAVGIFVILYRRGNPDGPTTMKPNEAPNEGPTTSKTTKPDEGPTTTETTQYIYIYIYIYIFFFYKSDRDYSIF